MKKVLLASLVSIMFFVSCDSPNQGGNTQEQITIVKDSTDLASKPVFVKNERSNTPAQGAQSVCGASTSSEIYSMYSDNFPTVGTKLFLDSSLQVAFDGKGVVWAVNWKGSGGEKKYALTIDQNGQVSKVENCQ
jgi:hypothetical protein